MTQMTERFVRTRWSATRKRIDTMKPGQIFLFPKAEYSNCHASVTRLNDAYGGERVYELTGGKGKPTVIRKI